MRWWRIFLWTGLGLVLVIVAGISYLFLVDLGRFKSQIESAASEATGRDVEINGKLSIDLASHSVVIAEDIRISNASWAEQPDMLSVERLEVRLDLRSVFSRTVVVESIDVAGMTIDLIKPEQGEPNWVMQTAASEQTSDDPTTDARGLIFERINVVDVKLSYRAPERDKPLLLKIDQLQQQHRDDNFLQLLLEGSVNDRVLKLDGEIGTWDALLQQGEVRFDLGGRLDTLVVNADGYIDDLTDPSRPRINFTAAAPDVNDVLQAFGVDRQGEGDISLVGSLTPEDQGPLVLDVAGDVGRLTVDASGVFSDLRNLEEIEFDLLANGEDVRPILEAFGIPQSKPVPLMVHVDAERQGGTLVVDRAEMAFGDAKFEMTAHLPGFPSIDDSDVKIRINGPDIERFRDIFALPGAATGSFSATLTVDVADDGFEFVNADLKTSLGELRAEGRLGNAPDYIGSKLDFELHSDSLATAASAYGIDNLPDRPIDVQGSAEISAHGIQIIDELTATVNEVTMHVGGLIKTEAGALGSDLDFTLDGPDLAVLIAAFASADGIPKEAYTLNGQLQVRADGYRFREVAGKIGTSEIELDGLLVPTGGLAGSRFTFAAHGASITELTAALGDVDVRPGPYQLGGAIELASDMITLSNVELERATGAVDLDLELGLPVSRRWMNFDVRAAGPNVRSLLRRVDDFEADEAPFLVRIQGNVRDTMWSLDQLDIGVGAAKLTAKGTLDLQDATASTLFTIDIDVPNTGALGELRGQRLREQSFSFDAQIAGSDGELRIEGLTAVLGESRAQGDVRYRLGDVPQLDVRLAADYIELATLLAKSEEETQEGVEEATDNENDSDGRVIPDVDIPFDAMAGINANVEVEIGELRRDSLQLRDVKVFATLRDGALDLSDVSFRARSGALAGRARLEPRDGEAAASFELVARDFALGMDMANRDLAMTSDIDIKLESTGTSLRTLAGNVDGVVFLVSQGGRIANNRALQFLYGNVIQQILSAINPLSTANPYTDFECIVLPIQLNAGVVDSNPSTLVATSEIQITSKSRIDLKTEEIEINIRTTPKKGISISAGEIVNPYIKVVGTLGSPRLAVDEKGVLLSGGAAVATGGISILASAAWSRLSRASDPCAQLTEDGLEELSTRFPELTVAVPPAEEGTPR